jgi:N utilization substance protein B
MASRSASRPIIISALYYLEQRSDESLVDEVVDYVVDEHSDGDIDRSFVVSVVSGVQKKKAILDEIIAKAAPRWTHDMNVVDKAVLRAAIYELLFESDNIPAKVVISQAVALADTYAAPENRRFVNGVLGTIYREMEGEEVSGASKAASTDEHGNLVVEKAGGLVFAKHDNIIYLALVHDIWGYWTIAKGKIEPGEDAQTACEREIAEEIGLDARVVEQLGENIYESRHAEKGLIKNHIQYFLLTSKYEPLELETTGGLDDARWFPIVQLEKLRMYEDITQMVLKALPIIQQHNFEQ